MHLLMNTARVREEGISPQQPPSRYPRKHRVGKLKVVGHGWRTGNECRTERYDAGRRGPAEQSPAVWMRRTAWSMRAEWSPACTSGAPWPQEELTLSVCAALKWCCSLTRPRMLCLLIWWCWRGINGLLGQKLKNEKKSLSVLSYVMSDVWMEHDLPALSSTSDSHLHVSTSCLLIHMSSHGDGAGLRNHPPWIQHWLMGNEGKLRVPGCRLCLLKRKKRRKRRRWSEGRKFLSSESLGDMN